MEIAVLNPQAVLQMYPWHSLATSPLAADKETIIANADFTTTSAIARRRLSSKKRRMPAGDSTTIHDGGDIMGCYCSDGSPSNSPTGSLDSLNRTTHGPSTAITTTTASSTTIVTQTPSPSLDRTLSDIPTTYHHTHNPPHTHTHQVVPSHPRATIGPHGGSVSLVPTTYQFAPALPVGSTAPEHEAFAHPMYSHLQQELNYRYLQDQSGPSSVRHGNRGTAAFSAPNSQANSNNSVLCTAMDIASSSSCGLSTLSEGHRPQIKWCSAHVAIAKQILAHQQQNVAHSVVSTAENGINSKPHPSSNTMTTTTNTTTTLDPAQQIALLQMYGVPTTTTTIPGYMTLPGTGPHYTTVPELQLHNMSFVSHTAPNTALFMDASNMLSIKPIPGQAITTTQAASNPSQRNVQMVNGIHLLPYTGAPQSLPMAAVLPGGTNPCGPYVGHVPVPVIGNCVLNPCQSGVMATPWVR